MSAKSEAGMRSRRVPQSAGSTRDVNIAVCLTSQEQGVLSCHYHLLMMLFIFYLTPSSAVCVSEVIKYAF